DGIREELMAAQERLTDFHTTDRVTGLLTREEVLRRVELLRAQEMAHELTVFEVNETVGDTVLRQIGTKLAARFRHQDLIARWTDRSFLVVFRGDAQLAERRAAQIAAQIAGRYQDEDGEPVDISLTARAESLAAATI